MKQTKALRKDNVISASEKAYINTSEPITARTQCWRMMAPARMIEILDYSLATHRLTPEERLRITETKILLISMKTKK